MQGRRRHTMHTKPRQARSPLPTPRQRPRAQAISQPWLGTQPDADYDDPTAVGTNEITPASKCELTDG